MAALTRDTRVVIHAIFICGGIIIANLAEPVGHPVAKMIAGLGTAFLGWSVIHWASIERK